jgi:hypothetical protein
MNIGTPASDYENNHIAAMKSGSALPFCNRVCGTQDTNIGDIITVKMFYQATPFRWFVDFDDAVLKKQLETFGLQFKVSYPAMSLALADLKTVDSTNKDLKVVKIDNDQLEVWVKTVCAAYSIPAIAQFKIFVEYLAQRASSDQLHFFIGYYEDKPVATSLIIDHADLVGLHWVGVVPQYRAHGFGHAVSCAALSDAQSRSKKQAILLASTTYSHYDVYGY